MRWDTQRPSTDMHQILDMLSFAIPSQKMIIRTEDAISHLMKFLYRTAQEIFSLDNKIAVCDPVYPVYVDSNVMAGRAGDYDAATERFTNVIYMPCTAENNFTPELPKETPDLIYLCFPNNPTGAMVSKAELQKWVDYANKVGAIILYDAAYEAYISEKDIPHSIYE